MEMFEFNITDKIMESKGYVQVYKRFFLLFLFSFIKKKIVQNDHQEARYVSLYKLLKLLNY